MRSFALLKIVVKPLAIQGTPISKVHKWALWVGVNSEAGPQGDAGACRSFGPCHDVTVVF